MSFKTASAILRGRWLIDKHWADAHMPLVVSVMKGDAKAAALLGLDDSEDDNTEEDIPANIAQNVYKVYPFSKLSDIPMGSIALIDIDGPLLKQGDYCSYGSEDYAEMMYSLMTAPNIIAAILDIDSPGGQADGTATFADAIKKFSTVKPIIGFVDDGLAASAAYWNISACSEIYMSQPTDQVGSIGVYCSVADWYALYKSEGLPIKDVYAPQSTDKNIEYRESIAGDDTLLKADLSVIADAFISTVKKNRAAKIKGTDWASGKMYFAADAIKLGLADGIKSFDQVVMRINSLLSQSNNSNKNKMAFEKTLAAAKASAENFKVVGAGAYMAEEGILVQESHLTNIEAHLAGQETSVTSLETQLSTEKTAKETAESSLAAANATIESQNTKITELEAKIVALGSEQGEEPKSTSRQSDEDPNKKAAYHLDDKNPINQLADNVMPLRS